MDTTPTQSSQVMTDLTQKMPVAAAEMEPQVQLTSIQVTAALSQAKETHRLVIEWVRSLDVKINPLLTASGALMAACVSLLGQQNGVLKHHHITYDVLMATLLPLLYTLLMAISALSPSLKWGRWGANRHLPERSKTKPTSHVFFGQIALYDSSDDYVEAARKAFKDESGLLDELLKQTYLNAKIAQRKSAHIAFSARGLFIAVVLLFLCAVIFTRGY